MLQNATMKLLVSAFFIALAPASFAETAAEKFQLNFYGNFIHTEKVPDTLFFFDEIEKDDSFDLRKAMRNHDIDIIVLSSGGGSVYEGLQMAGIIRDNKLTTYVPERGLVGDGNCASACAFMFFGGVNRESAGKLGVHQFYSQNSNNSAKIGEIQGGTQYTAGEIIGFLNDFDTPAFVYEKMFQQSDMYYFNKAELERLGAGEGTLSRSKTMKINAFIQNFVSEIEKLASKTVAPATPKVQAPKKKFPSPPAEFTVIERIQVQFGRLGCMRGSVTGVVDVAHKRAAYQFNRFNKTMFDVEKFFTTEKALNYLRRMPSGLCSSSSGQAPKKKFPSPPAEFTVIERIQVQFGRLGCMRGSVTGVVDVAHKRAAYQFNRFNKTMFDVEKFFATEKALNYLRRMPSGLCSSSSGQAPKKKFPSYQSEVNVIKAIQAQLNRIGCKLGKVDGLVGPASKRALNNFNRINNSSYAAKTFFTAPTMVTFLKGKPSGFCPVTTKNKTKSATKTVTQKNIRVRPRYELLVNCGNKNKKHWLHFWDPNATGWNRATVPSNVKYTFELENNGRGEYGLCGGLTCHWRFSGWALNQRNDTLTFRVNDYATEYSSKPAGFNGTYTFSKDGRTISGTDSNGCSVRGTAK